MIQCKLIYSIKESCGSENKIIPHHDSWRKSKSEEFWDVMQWFLREASPSLFAWRGESNVKCKDYGVKPIWNANSNGGSFNTVIKFLNEKPTKKQVQQAS